MIDWPGACYADSAIPSRLELKQSAHSLRLDSSGCSHQYSRVLWKLHGGTQVEHLIALGLHKYEGKPLSSGNAGLPQCETVASSYLKRAGSICAGPLGPGEVGEAGIDYKRAEAT